MTEDELKIKIDERKTEFFNECYEILMCGNITSYNLGYAYSCLDGLQYFDWRICDDGEIGNLIDNTYNSLRVILNSARNENDKATEAIAKVQSMVEDLDNWFIENIPYYTSGMDEDLR